MKRTPQNSNSVVAKPALSSTHEQQPPPQEQQSPAPSTSCSSSNAPQIALISHHPTSTSQVAAGQKRPRDVEGDSSTDNVEQPGKKSTPVNKRTRMQGGEPFQGVTQSGLDVEYQVPTTSQRDQAVIVGDSEKDGVGTADEGTSEVDDGPFKGYEPDEADELDEPEMAGNYNKSEGPDTDEDSMQLAKLLP